MVMISPHTTTIKPAPALIRIQIILCLGGFPSDRASLYPRLGHHRPLRNSHFQWDFEHLGQALNGSLGRYEIYVSKRVGALGGLFKTVRRQGFGTKSGFN